LTGLAAIKYEMETALNVIRAFLVSRASIAKYNAVQLYGVAWDLDFINEAKMLSTETLKCNLNTFDTQVYLENMSVTAILKLQQLHHCRKIVMLNALSEMVSDKTYYTDAATKYGVHRGVSNYRPSSFSVPWQLMPGNRDNYGTANYEWSMMRSEVSRIMEECPAGSEFFQKEGEFFFDRRFTSLQSVIDWRMLCRELRHIIDSSPKEIEV